MNAVRCPQGHFYDANKYDACPYCHAELRNSGPAPAAEHRAVEGTVVASYRMNGLEQKQSEKTRISFESQGFEKEPAAGWLVCVNGADKGQDFRFFNGQNSIGRGSDYRISLSDSKISRKSPAATLVFDAKNLTYYLSGGAADAELLVYLNGEPVFELTELKPYDTIHIGDTDLKFIPLCSNEFTWEY